jgi:hypothetical protein
MDVKMKWKTSRSLETYRGIVQTGLLHKIGPLVGACFPLLSWLWRRRLGGSSNSNNDNNDENTIWKKTGSHVALTDYEELPSAAVCVHVASTCIGR